MKPKKGMLSFFLTFVWSFLVLSLSNVYLKGLNSIIYGAIVFVLLFVGFNIIQRLIPNKTSDNSSKD